MELRQLSDLDLKGKTVLMRLDLNVPIKDNKISDETRIVAALPSIKYVLEHAKAVVICSHLGRPKGQRTTQDSLEPVGVRLAEHLNREVVFVDDYIENDPTPVIKQLGSGQFILYENLRFYPGETQNNLEFAQRLMRGIDVYVNDGFGIVHRAHASVVAAAEQVSPAQRAAGFLIHKEVQALSRLLNNPKPPFTVVMGGAKVADKIGVILNLMTRCNHLLIGGAMAYTFLKFKGHQVGLSRVESEQLHVVREIFEEAHQRNVSILLPVDHVGATRFYEDAAPVAIDDIDIPPQLMGLDIGPKTVAAYRQKILASENILWNGPMGVFEWQAFAAGTLGIAQAMAEAQGYTVVGGGDSVAAINLSGCADKISHISTGGGASLEFLEGKILPGLRVLARSLMV